MFPHLLSSLTSCGLDYYHTWRASWRRIPILGTFCRVSSPLLEVPPAQGVTLWVPPHAPRFQPLTLGVYLPSSRTTHLVHPWA